MRIFLRFCDNMTINKNRSHVFIQHFLFIFADWNVTRLTQKEGYSTIDLFSTNKLLNYYEKESDFDAYGYGYSIMHS